MDQHSEIEAEIRALLAEQDAAWARGDAEGFCARATDDVIFTNIVGMFAIGMAPFVAQHAHIFSTFYRGTTLHQQLVHWRLLRPEVAVAEVYAQVRGVRDTPDAIRPVDGIVRARPQQILVREAGEWRVAAFHNVAIAPGMEP